jgi:hypothetical protein
MPNIEACLSEIADWYIRNSKQFDPAEMNAIIKKYCKLPADEQYVLTYLGTRQGKIHFKGVMLERLKLVKWVQKENGSLLTVEAWEKEKEGLIRRGEYVPQIRYLTNPPSELRETYPKEPWQMTREEFNKYRNDAIQQLYLKYNKSDVNKFIKAVDARFYTPDILAFRKKLQIVVKEGDKANLYDFVVSRGDFVLIESKPFVEPQKPSNLIEPTFDDIEDSCQQVPARYRDLLPFLDQYPVGSFLLEKAESSGTAKIDAILQKLKEGVASIQDSTLFREYLLTMGKFWSYSVGNIMLIMLQKPNATRVAGFTTWKELGRFVKAGEKGIMILAPCLPPKGGYEYFIRGDDKYSIRFLEGQWYTYDINNKRGVGGPFKTKADVEIDLAKQGFTKVKEEPEASYETPRYFKVVYVFDISQTTGKELPEIEVKSLTGAANPELWDKMIALLKRKGTNLSFENKPEQDPEIKGQFNMPNNIWVRPEEPPAQQLKTIIHETGHYYTEGVFGTPRADAETIAESVAFVVGAHYGFDSGTRSFPYVAIWSQDKKVLDRNLAAIKNISSSILNDMEVKSG